MERGLNRKCYISPFVAFSGSSCASGKPINKVSACLNGDGCCCRRGSGLLRQLPTLLAAVTSCRRQLTESRHLPNDGSNLVPCRGSLASPPSGFTLHCVHGGGPSRLCLMERRKERRWKEGRMRGRKERRRTEGLRFSEKAKLFLFFLFSFSFFLISSSSNIPSRQSSARLGEDDAPLPSGAGEFGGSERMKKKRRKK